MREKLWMTSGLNARTACHSARPLRRLSAFDSELAPGQGWKASAGHSEPGLATRHT